MPGLIFPEKLVYNNDTFQTMQPSEVLDLLCNSSKGFNDCKKEKSSGNAAQSCVVTSTIQFSNQLLRKIQEDI